jgi:hypothetical protein
MMTTPYDLEQRRHRQRRCQDRVEQLEALTDDLVHELGPQGVTRLVHDQLQRSLRQTAAERALRR